MSNSKYDWAAHLPRMIELYMEQHSIPKIHEAIQNQSEGFTPSLAIVYSKLRSEGYPTEKAERARLLQQLSIARWPSDLPIRSNDGKHRQLHVAPSWLDNHPSDFNLQKPTSHSVASLDIDESNFTREIFTSNSTPPASELSTFASKSRLRSDLSPTTTQGDELQETHLCTLPEERLTLDGSETAYVDGFQEQHGTQLGLEWVDSFPNLGIDYRDYPDDILKTPSLPTSTIYRGTLESQVQSRNSDHLFNTGVTCADLRLGTQGCHQSRSIANDDNSTYVPDTPSPFTQPGSPSSSTKVSRTSGASPFGGQPLPWWRKVDLRHNRCLTPDNRNSTATSDSGYASGRNSPGNLLTESEHGNPRSLAEFRGLHRVPCLRLHEPRRYNSDYMPQPTGRFKDTKKCPHCQYSGIHNLCWSVKQLKREVFMSELKLDSIYDFKDLDTAGNNALHYAAVGGADFEHFAALIHAGANPYQLNTAGQLFLHYLHPQLKNPDPGSFDARLVTTFYSNLVNFLNCFQLTPAFRWRDNEGRNAADALAVKINDIDTAHHILRALVKAGHLSEEELDHSKTFRNSKEPSERSKSSALNDQPLSVSQQPKSSPKSDFELNEERQCRALATFHRASKTPSYVDPETGDNALHALARLRFRQTGFHKKILAVIRDFISQDGADLNLQNRQGDSPIASFICEEHFRGITCDETGATMSKYLDALLWKDHLRRIPNKINVNMRNREGATALYYAAVRGRPDSVRSLIEAGANVNATLVVGGHLISILQATHQAKSKAVCENDMLKIHLLNNVISYLEHEDAVADPTIFDERRLCANSVRVMPM